jgi:hypothetical protein
MTRDEALTKAHAQYVECGWMTPGEAMSRITTIRPIRRWPVFGRIVTWQTRVLLEDTAHFGIVEVDDATGRATARSELTRNPR